MRHTFLAILIACASLGLYWVADLMAPSDKGIATPTVKEHKYLYLPNNYNFKNLLNILHYRGYVADTAAFAQAVRELKLDTMLPPAGKYPWPKLEDMRLLADSLFRSKPEIVKLHVTYKRSKESLASLAGQHLQADSATVLSLLNDKVFLQKYGYTPDNILCAVIPNTYHFDWNTDPEKFIRRLIFEARQFWSEDRLKQARALGLDTKEVYILASIVEKEARFDHEKSKMAGVFLNRLRKEGGKLQSNPTVIFAAQDFSIKELNDSLRAIDSPYNTYRYAGLPPGPIAMPSLNTLEQVLKAERHDYYYFCGRGDGSGLHDFSKTFKTHKVFAKRYHETRKH